MRPVSKASREDRERRERLGTGGRQACWPGSIGYGRHMPNTKLLASGNPIDVDAVQSELAQLNVSSYRTIRLSAGNGDGSPAPVIVAVSHVDQPDTPNANAITAVDSFTLAPGESVSKVYEVPGEVVVSWHSRNIPRWLASGSSSRSTAGPIEATAHGVTSRGGAFPPLRGPLDPTAEKCPSYALSSAPSG